MTAKINIDQARSGAASAHAHAFRRPRDGREEGPPTPPFFVSADSKGVADVFLVSAYCKGLSGLTAELADLEVGSVRRNTGVASADMVASFLESNSSYRKVAGAAAHSAHSAHFFQVRQEGIR